MEHGEGGVVALVALSSERSPVKRSFLKLCAGVSTAAIVIPLIVVIAAISSSGTDKDTKGPCVGGPEIGASGTPDSNGYVTFPCSISGTARVRMPDSRTP